MRSRPAGLLMCWLPFAYGNTKLSVLQPIVSCSTREPTVQTITSYSTKQSVIQPLLPIATSSSTELESRSPL